MTDARETETETENGNGAGTAPEAAHDAAETPAQAQADATADSAVAATEKSTEQALADAATSEGPGPSNADASADANATPEAVDADEAALPLDEDFSWPERPKRRGPGVALALAAVALCAFLAFESRHAFAYWLTASGEPVTLDAQTLADATALDALDNHLVRIQGTPGASAARFKERFVARELVAIGGTPVLLQRAPTRAPGSMIPQDPPPDRAPVDVTGRLVRDSSLDRDYGEAFAAFLQRGEVELVGGHVYVLIQDERPRAGWQTPLLLLALALLAFVNGRYIVRSWRR